MENIFKNAKFGDKFMTRDGGGVYSNKPGLYCKQIEIKYGQN